MWFFILLWYLKICSFLSFNLSIYLSTYLSLYLPTDAEEHILYFMLIQFSSVAQFSVQLYVTPWTAPCQASLTFTISQSLLRFLSIESKMLSNHLILYRTLLLLPSVFPSVRVFANESALCSRWPKYWSQLQHQSFQWIFRVDFLWVIASYRSERRGSARSL